MSVADTVDQLLHKVHVRDVAVQQLKDRAEAMQADYEHNFRLLQKQTIELQTLQATNQVQLKQIRTLETKNAAQVQKIKNFDEEVRRQSQGMLSQNETLRGQVTVLQNELTSIQRSVAEKDVELGALRRDLQEANGRIARQSQTVRREVLQEHDNTAREKERLLRLREDQLLRDVNQVEARCLELSSENTRLKEEKSSLESRFDELHRISTRKDFTVTQLQEQITELKRQHGAKIAKLEEDTVGSNAIREQMERSCTTQVLTLQREVEKRNHDVEALEQKLTAQRNQHDAELRRKTEEREELVRNFEDKCRALHDRVRHAESREAAAQEDNLRLQRRCDEAKRSANTSVGTLVTQEERLEELQRLLSSKDQELRRAVSEVQRLQQEVVRRTEEADELRNEFERRSWQDRVVQETELEAKRLEYRRHGDQRVQQSVMMNQSRVQGQGATSAPPSPWTPQAHPNDLSSYHHNGDASLMVPPSGSLSYRPVSDLVSDVRTQIQQSQEQQHQQQSYAVGASSSSTPLRDVSASRFNSVSSNRFPLSSSKGVYELALLKEQHAAEKRDMERRLQDAMRLAERQQKRAAALQEELFQDLPSSAPHHSRGSAGQRFSTATATTTAAASGLNNSFHMSSHDAARATPTSFGDISPSMPPLAPTSTGVPTTGAGSQAVGGGGGGLSSGASTPRSRVEEIQQRFATPVA